MFFSFWEKIFDFRLFQTSIFGRPPVKGIGGVQGDLSDFLYFGICCSPSYEDSKMGSHSFQFSSVVVWQLARGYYPFKEKLSFLDELWGFLGSTFYKETYKVTFKTLFTRNVYTHFIYKRPSGSVSPKSFLKYYSF